MIFFILPIGALFSGLAGASGYYVGARLLNHRPTPLLCLNIVLASVGTFFALHYFSYVTLEVEGKNVSDYISFGTYLDTVIRSTSMRFSVRGRTISSTGELGGGGYEIALLQNLGFAAGGFAVYTFLVSIPYCQRCSRYFSAKGKQTRYTSDPKALEMSAVQLAAGFEAGSVASAVDEHGRFGTAKPRNGDFLRSIINIRNCKRCGRHWAKFIVEKKNSKDWDEISELSIHVYTDQVVDV